jgi:UPF0755 protein
MKRVMRRIIILICIVSAVLALWLWYDAEQFLSTPLKLPPDGVKIEVKQGSNLIRVARMLEEKGIMRKPRYFVWYARWIRHSSKISVGEYQIAAGTTPKALLTQLVEGKVIQYSITLVEGWTFMQALDAIQSDPYLVHQLEGLDDDTIMSRLGYAGQHPEGRFMPDTYYFPRGMTDIAFLQRSYQAMQAFLQHAWRDRDVGIPLKSPYEALILASIVEKETGLASERRAIAGVFTRRLIKHMRLQSDPTVIYGMGDTYKGNIRRRDLRSANAYNTYQHAGLPPTPIALPGRAAIRAVLHPQEGNALYFVSRGDGSHHFSATLEEHNKAVIKYQLKGRNKPFSSYQPSTSSNNK